RSKNHGCDYLPGGRALGHWLEHGRIVNDPDDVDTIVKKIRETDVKQWTNPVTGRTFEPNPPAEFRSLTGMIEQEVAQYRGKRPHPALGRKIDFMKGKGSGGRTRLGMGYRYSREDGEKIKEWYEAKANGKVGKAAEAADLINALV